MGIEFIYQKNPQQLLIKKRPIIDVEILLGVLFYIVIVLTSIVRYDFHLRDSYLYAKHINEWLLTANLPRGETYPLLGLSLMSIPFRFFGYDVLKGAIIANICLGEVVVIFIIKSARLITKSSLCALFTGIITACNQSFITFSIEALRENSYMACFSIIMFCSIEYIITRKALFVSMIGFFTGLGIACRHEGIELIIYSMIPFVFADGTTYKKMKAVKRVLYSFVFLVLGITLAALISNSSISRTVGLNYIIKHINK